MAIRPIVRVININLVSVGGLLRARAAPDVLNLRVSYGSIFAAHCNYMNVSAESTSSQKHDEGLLTGKYLLNVYRLITQTIFLKPFDKRYLLKELAISCAARIPDLKAP